MSLPAPREQVEHAVTHSRAHAEVPISTGLPAPFGHRKPESRFHCSTNSFSQRWKNTDDAMRARSDGTYTEEKDVQQ